MMKYAMVSPEKLSNEVHNIPSMKRKLLCIYKEFYKLRNVIDNKKYYQNTYKTLLRRNFTNASFINRRDVVMPDLPPLSEDELIIRLVNTLAFVFNSTVKSSKEAKPILFFQDIKENNTDTLEKAVVFTMLQMDSQKPKEIKYDFKYNWIKQLEEDILKYDNLVAKGSTKSSKIKHTIPLDYIGFKQYEENIMRLNETLGLCL